MVKKIETVFSCKPGLLSFGTIPICSYKRGINDEIKEENLNREEALGLLEQMYMIRTLEEMLSQINAGIYKPLKDFSYIGPTHLSIGQEATSVGSISALGVGDYITSSHRGHGDALAKGYSMIKSIDDNSLEKE